MAPISPPKTLPVALKIAGGLNPERTIFIDGGVPKNTKWFDITLQCGPSLNERDDIAFRLLLTFFDAKYSSYMTNSCVNGKWDDERGRRHEMRLKGLTDKPEILDFGRCISTSTTYLQSLRCSTVEKRDSEKEIFISSKQYDMIKIKSYENAQTDGESVRILASEFPDRKTMPAKSSHNLNKDTLTSRYILEPVAETIQLSVSQHNLDKSQMKSPDKVVMRTKSSVRSNASTSKEVRRTKSYESLKLTPKSVRLLQDTFNTPSYSKSKPNNVDPSVSGLVNIYTPTSLRIADSVYIRPDHEAVRFSNKYDSQTTTESEVQEIHHEEEDYSNEELNQIELVRGEPFSLAVECLENGYLAFLNGELFCVYPHHFDYHLVKYIVFNGEVDLEQVEVGGGNGPDRTLVVDLYDEVVWTENVVVLTDENFAELVLDSNEIWMVDAYTAWCPACNKLQPAWDMAAKTLKGQVKLGASDCDRNEQLTEDLNVEYFPTIYCFMRGKKNINIYTLYQGRYSVDSIVPWALHILRYGNINLPNDALNDPKATAKTLRKQKKPIMGRKGYLAGGYGYVLRKDGECIGVPTVINIVSSFFILASGFSSRTMIRRTLMSEFTNHLVAQLLVANQHETSSTKFIYISKFCQTHHSKTNEDKSQEVNERKKKCSTVICACDTNKYNNKKKK